MKRIIVLFVLSFFLSNLYSQQHVSFSKIVFTETSQVVTRHSTNEYSKNCLLDFNVQFTYPVRYVVTDPYDFDFNVLQVHVKNENGDIIKTVDGFFKYNPSTAFENSWHVRLSFTEVGNYDLEFRMYRTGADLSGPLTIPIQITDSNDCNYMPRLQFADNNYMETEHGDPFFSVGAYLDLLIGPEGEHFSGFNDYQSYSSSSTKTRYDDLVTEFANYGGNTIKYSMTPNKSQDVEWNQVGDYSDTYQRQDDLDHIVKSSQERGVYLILSLFVNDQTGNWFTQLPVKSPDGSQGWDPYRRFLQDELNWNYNLATVTPYSPHNGNNDPRALTELTALYGNQAARKYQKRKIRYVNARWGYSNTVLGYEIHNELNAGYYSFMSAVLGEWVADLACFIKNDLNSDKLVSLSTAHKPSSFHLTDSDCIDFEYPHYGDVLNFAQRNASLVKNLMTKSWINNHNKPTIAGDWAYAGIDFDGNGPDPECAPWENTKNMLHNALWSSSFTGAFGACYPFYSESDIWSNGKGPVNGPNTGWKGPDFQHPNKGVFHYGPLTSFFQGETLNEGEWTPIATKPEVTSGLDKDFLNYNPQSSSFNTWYYKSADDDFSFWLGDMLTTNLLFDFTGTPSNPNITTTNNNDIEVFALKNVNKIIGWVHNKDFNWKNVPNGFNSNGASGAGCSGPLVEPDMDYNNITTIKDETLTINNLVCDGPYKIEWYNTHSNKMDLRWHIDNTRTVSPWEGVDVNGDDIADNGGKFTHSDFQEFNQQKSAVNGSLTFEIPDLERLNLTGSSKFAPDYGFKITKITPTDDESVVSPIGALSFNRYGTDKNCYYKVDVTGGQNATRFDWTVNGSPVETLNGTLSINFEENTTFTICVKAINDCTESNETCRTFVFPACNNDDPEFESYPNPCTDRINIRNKGKSKMDYEIIDRNGLVVIRIGSIRSGEKMVVDVSKLRMGTYTIIGICSDSRDERRQTLIFEKISDR